jgi:hypothetical protein
MNNTSEICNVSLQIEEISPSYDFLGIRWNHNNNTVELAKKTKQKLPEFIPDQMTAHELEGLIGRLIFVAQFHQEPLVNHYWLLKWARRFFNALNNGKLEPSAIVNIPPSASFSLKKWLIAAKIPHKVRFSNFSKNKNNNNNKSGVLFTDASFLGWGGVLLLNDGSIHVVGGKFSSSDHNNNIAVAENMAVNNSIRDLKEILATLSRVDILVDNTSVEAGLRRGMPRSEALAESVKKFWNQILNINIFITVGRVSTKLNPADSISRGKSLEFEKLEQAHGNFVQERNNENSEQNQNKRLGLVERHILF